MLDQPFLDRWRFMCRCVIQHNVHPKTDRHCCVDSIEELAELDRTMPFASLVHDLTCGDIQGGVQINHAVTLVIMRASLYLTRPHWQGRLSTVQGLDTGFLVHAQDYGVLRWVHVQPDDVTDFVNEQRILRQLEPID